jgi:hypothetical protein
MAFLLAVDDGVLHRIDGFYLAVSTRLREAVDEPAIKKRENERRRPATPYWIQAVVKLGHVMAARNQKLK